MIDGFHQRILSGVAATLSWQPQGSDGEPADPGTVTVGVTRADGTVLVAALTATAGSGASPRTVTLTAAQTANLDRLTATWTVAGTVVAATFHEIVGGFYFSAAELRGVENSTADASANSLTAVHRVRAEVEAIFEANGRPAFVPRFTVERLTRYGSGARQMLSGWPVRNIRWVRQWYATGTGTPSSLDYTVDELAAVYVDVGSDVAVFPTWFTGYASVEVGYEYGMDAPPADVKREALTLARSLMNRHRSAVPDRAVSMTSPEGTSFQLGRIGTQWRPTGIDSVDEILNRPEFRRACIG